MKRILTVMITALICLTSFTFIVHADEYTDENEYALEEGSFMVDVTFDMNTTAETGQWDFEYNDNWFKNSATQYNHKLAQLTFGMAVSAFRPKFDYEAEGDPAAHVKSFLKMTGFKDQRMDDYDKNPSLYTVSTVLAHKEIKDEVNGDFELIAIGICGGGYKNEWLSNFTIGDETIHVGFNSAASEVFDRVFGYIAQHNLQNKKLKIWFGGFSRAGAISNVLASKLVDCDTFSTDTVFTYTFATPRTTKQPKRGIYPNIYNIVGKMDPVPSVPFADWGYERYGTTLMLPAQETDSDYALKFERAYQVYYKLVGIAFWNNVEINTKLRVILNYLLKLLPTSQTYEKHMQSHMLSIWEDRRVTNVMDELMEIAGNKELINDNNQKEANSLLTYVAYSAYNYATNRSIETKYASYESTLTGNLAHEHTPEVYLAWLFSQPDGDNLYSNNIDYLRLVVSGDVTVGVIDVVTDQIVKVVTNTGDFVQSLRYGDKYYDEMNFNVAFFADRDGDNTIMLIPKDHNYKIVVVSEADQTISVHGLKLTVGKTNGKFSKLYKLNMKTGGYQELFSFVNRDITGDGYYGIVDGDTIDISTMTKDATSFAVDLENSNIFNLSWREMVVLIYTVPTLIIGIAAMLITWMAGTHKLKRKINAGVVRSDARYDKVPSACITICAVLFAFQELAYWLMPSYLLTRSILKLGIGIITIMLALRGYRKQENALNRSLVHALMVSTVADLLINYEFRAAMGIYTIAILILCYRFYKFERVEKGQWFMWAVTSAACTVYILSKYLPTYETLATVIYAIILMLMLSLSVTMPKKIKFASWALTLSNVIIFMTRFIGAKETLPLHVLSLGLYYIAATTFASATKFNKPITEETVDYVRKSSRVRHRKRLAN